MDDFYLIAEVKDYYSSDGSVIIKSFSDFPERFLELEKVVINFFGKSKELTFDYTKKVDNFLIAKFRNINSKEDVSFLIGEKLYVSKDNLHVLPDETYYIHDLEECDVYIDVEFFGKLKEVLRMPYNDIYLVQKDDGKEIMIPAVEEFIRSIDQDNKKVILDIKCKMFDEYEN